MKYKELSENTKENPNKRNNTMAQNNNNFMERLKGAKKISAEELFGGKEELEEFNRKMSKVHRDFLRKSAQSEIDASKVILY